MLVEMGDIPKPDSSVLLKNIFGDYTANPKQTSTPKSTNESSTSNKRSLDTSQQQQQQLIQEDELNTSNVENKKRKFDDVQSEILNSESNKLSTGSDHDNDINEDEDDCFGDEHIISAAVVRRPFT